MTLMMMPLQPSHRMPRTLSLLFLSSDPSTSFYTLKLCHIISNNYTVFFYFRMRLSADGCLQHKWLAQAKQSMKSVKLPTDRLKKFIIRRKWQVWASSFFVCVLLLFLNINSMIILRMIPLCISIKKIENWKCH